MANPLSKGFKSLGLLVLSVNILGWANTPSFAQDSNNILGLPAVPQRPATPASGPNTSANKTAAPAKPTDAQIKAVLSGKLTAASTYQDGLVTVRVATERTFITAADRAQAVQAAKIIQRDARLACGKLCQPAPMPAPVLQPDNTLSFDIVVSGYEGNLSMANVVNMVSSKPISRATEAAPVATPAVALAPPAATFTTPTFTPALSPPLTPAATTVSTTASATSSP